MNSLQEKIFDVIVAILRTKSLNKKLTGEFEGRQAIQHSAIRYGILNYVAKYSLARENYLITDVCHDYLCSKCLIVDGILLRGAKGSKNKFTYEHPVPSNIISNLLIECRNDHKRMQEILQITDKVTVLTYDENKKLKGALVKSMPNQKSWTLKNCEDSIFARYIDAKVEIPKNTVKVRGALRR